MKRIKIDFTEFPPVKGESWWIVHPNTAGAEFRIPSGAISVCTKDFMDIFKQNVVYNILSADNHNGWITVEGNGNIYDMPQYLFARYFDAEVFVTGKIDPAELERAKPFDYKSTLPMKPRQMEMFADGKR
jgi:hypothetical protein